MTRQGERTAGRASGAVLGGAVATVEQLAAGAAAAVGADIAVLLRAADAGARLELVAVHSDDVVSLAAVRTVSVRGRNALAEAFRTRAVVESGRPLVTMAGGAVSAAAPLMVDGDRLGVVGFEFHGGEAPEAETVAAVAAAVAHAFDHLDRETAHERGQRLQKVTSLVAGVLPRRQIATVVLDEAVAATGAVAGFVVVHDPSRDEYRVAAHRGYTRELIAPFDPLPLDVPTPVRDAALTGKLVAIESRAEYLRRYPVMHERLPELPQLPDRAVAALPLSAGGKPFGALGLTFGTPRILDGEERGFLLALASLCAQALDRSERARLYERVRRLQAVTAQLARAVTPEDVGRVVVTEATQALGAAAGRIVQVTAEGTVVTLGQTAVLDETVARLESTPAFGEMPIMAVIERNSPTLVIESLDEVDGEWQTAASVLGAIGFRAVAAAALPGPHGPIGALGFAWHEPHPLLHENEEFLRAMAAVCAQALERTRLFDETERSQARLRSILDRLDEAVVVVDPLLEVGYANREAGLLFGTSELVGRRLPDPWPELRLREIGDTAMTTGAEPYDTAATVADGRAFEISAIPENGGAILVLRDVTRRQRQEQAEREFVSNASHELRTPLAAIAAAVDALQGGAKENVGDRDFLLDGIAGEVARLSRLSDALLLLARAQSDPASFTLEPVDFEQLLTEIVARVEARPGVRILTDLRPCAGRGDRTLLLAAVSNLLQNAVRHTARGSIEVACRLEREHALIVIADTGDGMSAELRARATERFYRGPSASGDGFGLGLALARQIVDLVDGSIAIEPRPGGGTRMTVSVPAV